MRFPVVTTINSDSGYTKAQIQAYGQQCRAEALEEAAQVCESLACTDDHAATVTRLECAEKIRSMK
jgi:hypothetical protein